MRRRVVITGLGLCAPHGSDLDSAVMRIFNGESAVSLVRRSSKFGEIALPGAVVQGEPWKGLNALPFATCDRVSLLALVAAEAALNDSKLNLATEKLDRVGVAVGTSLGGVASEDSAYFDVYGQRKDRLSPFTLVKVMYNGPATQIALRYGILGPSLTYSTTCSSSSVSIGESMRTIRHGYADVILAGGADAPFSYVSLIAWQALHVLAPADQSGVSVSCRPFSGDRAGTVLGEGSAFLVLESLDHALERGARIYGELAGYGSCNDSTHMTQPSVEGQARTMRAALADAGMSPSDIDYINAHGTGTPLNDKTETSAIKSVFGAHAPRLSVSSTKSTHGHLVGAAGAIELLITTEALRRQIAPPTANLRIPDPECDLDYVPIVGRRKSITAALTNSFAVGGTAAALVIKAFDQPLPA